MLGNRNRDATGRWLKGTSGNPSGRPLGYADLVEATHSEAPDTVRKLVWRRDNADSDAVRLAACRELLDRAFGKPPQAVEIGGENGGPRRSEIIIRKMFVPIDEAGHER